MWCRRSTDDSKWERGGGEDLLLLPDAEGQLVPAEAHDEAGAEKKGGGAEAAGGEIALL